VAAKDLRSGALWERLLLVKIGLLSNCQKRRRQFRGGAPHRKRAREGV